MKRRVLVVAATERMRKRLASAVAPCAEVVLAPRERAGSPARAVDESRPDLALIAAPGRDVARLVGDLLRAPSMPPIVLLVDDPARVWRSAAVRRVVHGVLPHDAGATAIQAAARAALAGLVVLHRSALARTARSGDPGDEEHRAMTPREIEILGLMAEGLANKAIAARLRISDHTVKFHAATILSKLHAESRAHAVARGLAQGIILV